MSDGPARTVRRALVTFVLAATLTGCGSGDAGRERGGSSPALTFPGTPYEFGEARATVPRAWSRAPRAQSAQIAAVFARRRSGAASAWVTRRSTTLPDGRRLPVLVISGADVSDHDRDPVLADYANGVIDGFRRSILRSGGTVSRTDREDPIEVDGEDAVVAEVGFAPAAGLDLTMRIVVVQHRRFAYQALVIGTDADRRRMRSVLSDLESSWRWR